jgi:cell division transport system permease protein
MKIIKLWRTFKEGASNYRRNGWLTFATASVLTLSMFVIGLSALIGFAGHLSLRSLEEKISISVSFKPETSEARILSIQQELAKAEAEIDSIRYVSREQALEEFLSDGNPIFSDAVKEIGENPLLSSLVIKATDPDFYGFIATKIQDSAYAQDIERINYERNREKIERLGNLTDRVRNIGLILGGTFSLVALLITFNTIRLTIYSHRQEFEVMRLVGASNLYIKMPFFFEGIFYGLTAAILTIIFLTGATFALSENLGAFFSDILDGKSFFGIYLSFLWIFVPSIIIASVLFGVVSSFIAIRRYLRI